MFVVVYCNYSYITIQTTISFINSGSVEVWWGWWAAGKPKRSGARTKNKTSRM
ncbi:MAG: hypothetical protein WC717_00505 [Candidatus Micrarchaeia archaeon]